MVTAKTGGNGRKPALPSNRYAILLYDDVKGLLDAVVCFEDGNTTVVTFPPPRQLHSPWVMAESLNGAQHILTHLYLVPSINIQVRAASLEPRGPQAGRHVASRSRALAKKVAS